MKNISKWKSSQANQGDNPATQATRLANASNHLFYPAGSSIFKSSSLEPNEEKLKEELWGESDHDIQSITSHGSKIAAIDGRGKILLGNEEKMESISKDRNTEFSWCGVSFNKVDGSLASSRMWDRKTSIINSSTTFLHELPPVSISASDLRSHIFVINEWNEVTIWDVRQARGGLVERLRGNQVGGAGILPLWASASIGNYICFGGEDRLVSIIDDRKWRVVDIWKAPVKHDIVGLQLFKKPISEELCCLVLGLDHELAEWTPSFRHRKSQVELRKEDEVDDLEGNLGRLHHNHRVFRAKGRWSGITVSSNDSNTFYGRDDEGTIYSFSWMYP